MPTSATSPIHAQSSGAATAKRRKKKVGGGRKIHDAPQSAMITSASPVQPVTPGPVGSGASLGSSLSQRPCHRETGSRSVVSFTLVGTIGLCSSLRTCLRDDLLHLGHERGAVVGNAVLDRPLDAAGVDGF